VRVGYLAVAGEECGVYFLVLDDWLVEAVHRQHRDHVEDRGEELVAAQRVFGGFLLEDAGVGQLSLFVCLVQAVLAEKDAVVS
jgi:hypothetical protein